MTLDQITVGMEQLINTKASEILSTKPQDQQYLNWRDMQEVCLIVKSACVKQFNEVPQGVEMACYFAEAVLAPDKKAKLKLIKQVISLTSGTAGITIILAGEEPPWDGAQASLRPLPLFSLAHPCWGQSQPWQEAPCWRLLPGISFLTTMRRLYRTKPLMPCARGSEGLWLNTGRNTVKN